MRRLMLVVSSLVVAAAAGAVRADEFSVDRKYDLGPAMVIYRLYAGRIPTHRCDGRETIELCSRLAAVPEALECRARNDGLQICHGKKKLYRGNGDTNVSIGPEWREFRLRDGKIVAEWAVIQMAELLPLGAQPSEAERRCEDFGAPGHLECKDATPIGPLPPPAELPHFNRAYSKDEVAQAAGTVQVMQYCIQAAPALREDATGAYTRWRQSRADLAQYMEQALTVKIAAAVARSPANDVESQEFEQCGGMVSRLESQLRAPNPKFKTPEGTWTELKAALARGDGAAAAACFANPYDNFGRLMKALSSEELKQLGASLVKFEMAALDVKNFRTGIVERSDGMSGQVLFVKSAEEWRIAQM